METVRFIRDFCVFGGFLLTLYGWTLLGSAYGM